VEGAVVRYTGNSSKKRVSWKKKGSGGEIEQLNGLGWDLWSEGGKIGRLSKGKN